MSGSDAAGRGTLDENGQIDPARGILVTCVGKKRTGKSVMGLLFFSSYPGDRVVLDIAGDDGPTGPDVIELTGTVDELPSKWPEHLRRVDDNNRPLPMTLRYVPDPGSPTVTEDMDAVVGLAMTHGDCAILVHEMGRLARSNRVPPHTLRLLQHNRHQRVTGIFCAPRTKTMDPLVVGQADLLYVFTLPSQYDRKMVSENIGWPEADFDDAVHALRGHEHLRYDDNMPAPEREGDVDMRLVHCPPLPADVVADIERWARGERDRVPTPEEHAADRAAVDRERGVRG